MRKQLSISSTRRVLLLLLIYLFSKCVNVISSIIQFIICISNLLYRFTRGLPRSLHVSYINHTKTCYLAIFHASRLHRVLGKYNNLLTELRLLIIFKSYKRRIFLCFQRVKNNIVFIFSVLLFR